MVIWDKVAKWWDSHTEHNHGTVVLAASLTSFLWGFLQVQRFRAYLSSDIDAVTSQTPYRTWRTVSFGPLVFAFRLPKFVEDRFD